MTSPDERLSARDILYHLPELLEGADPVAARPAVREHLLADAEARAAVGAVAEMVRVVDQGERREAALVTQCDRRFVRSIDLSKQFFRERLGEILMWSGLGALQQGTKGSTFFTGLRQWTHTPLSGDEIARNRSMLLDFLGMSPSEAAHVLMLSTDPGPSASTTSLVFASEALAAAEQMLPREQSIAYYRVRSGTYDQPERAIAAWSSVLMCVDYEDIHAYALGELGHEHSLIGNPRAAVDYQRQAVEQLPAEAMFAFNGLLAALLARDESSLSFFVDHFTRHFSSHPTEDEGYTLAIRSDSHLWVLARHRSPREFERYLSKLPDRLSSVVREVSE